MVTTWVPAAALVPKPPTVSCDAVQAVMVSGNVVEVVLSPPGGGIVVGTVAAAAFTVVGTVGELDVVQPPRTKAKTTVAVTPSFRTVVISLSAPSGVSPVARCGHCW